MRVAPEHPLNLAVLRIAVAIVVLLTPALHEAVRWASLPAAMQVPLPGLWSLPIPMTPQLARYAQVGLFASSLAMLIGWRTRVATIVAAVLATYVLGLPQRFGNVIHHHHLVWMLAILAASPCGDALSVDAADRRDRGEVPGPSTRHAIPLVAARLLIAIVFFFPGIWKLRASGLAWITSDNLRNQMWWKWFQFGGHRPFVRIDQHPWICRALAGIAVLFEVSFPIWVFARRFHLVALVLALGFHVFASIFLRIDFGSLWVCYVVFVDWSAIVHKLRRRPQPEPSTGGASWLALAIPSLVVAAATVYGVAGQMRAWPFACYPTFQWMVGPRMPGLRVSAVHPNGVVTELSRDPRVHPWSQAEWGVAWSLAGFMGDGDLEPRLRAYWLELARDPVINARAQGAIAIRFERVWWSVDPRDGGKPPVATQTIHELR